MPKHAVQQRSPTKGAIAKRRADMLGFGQVDAAEVAFGENDTLGAKLTQIVVAEVVAVEFPLDPDRFVVTHVPA